MKIFTHLKEDKKNEIYTVALFAISLFIFLALISFPSEKNYIGIVGSYLAKRLIVALGSVGAYLCPLSLLIWGWQRIKEAKKEALYIKIIGFVVFLISVCGLLSLFNNDELDKVHKIGGYIGAGAKYFLIKYVGLAGAYLVLFTTFVLSLLLTTKFSFILVFSFIKNNMATVWNRINSLIQIDFSRRKFEQKRAKKFLNISRQNKSIAELLRSEKESPEIKITKIEKIKPESQEVKDKKDKISPQKSVYQPIDQDSMKTYTLPSLGLLNNPPPIQTGKMEEILKTEAETLEKTLQNFGIVAKVTQICPGPVITRYELRPAPGVKVNSIVSLSDDISLALKASHIRIMAPIPGKAVVGIEVPNHFANIVCLRELVGSKEFQNTKFELPLALGKTISGETYIADLEQMPHLLIAGATGSGKSICIHSLINSILFNANPEKIKFLMIDPKMIELPIYNDIPHLITPVITDSRKATHALKWLVSEMESRYKLFAQVKARDIASYNAIEDINKIPYLILIVDELADLMMVASIEVEEAIIRIAQMARAVGIHIILATQRPSVDVLTGVIKANFPARIAFQTLSAIDSRIILDMAGAEQLLGKGDMLFLPPGAPKPIRLQGALISQKEAEKVVHFISQETKVSYRDDIFCSVRDTGSYETKKDVLSDDAVRLIINTGQASISLLQRRLNIGYNRAARLIDSLEEQGIIGPADGTKPREILVSEDYLQINQSVTKE